MNKVYAYMLKYKNVLLISFMLMVLLQVLFVVTNDVGYLFLSILTIPMSSLVIYLFKDKINKTWKYFKLFKYSYLIIVAMVLLIGLLSSIMIHPNYLLSLIIPIYLLIQYFVIFKDLRLESVSKKEKLIMIYGSISIFIGIVGLFFIPSLIANDNHNPRITYPSNYNAVDSYQIYFETGQRDREHVIPQSWFIEPYVHDYVNVIWSNKIVNQSRGSLMFKDIPKTTRNEIKIGEDIVGYKNGGYFMPLDHYKGDVARIVLYMYVTYKDEGIDVDLLNISLMKSWAKLDPVDQGEIDRNNEIKRQYGYGNKFVEIPWLVGFVV